MTYPFDIPGYVQGYRFSDDALFYDADRKAFRDLAGYGADLTITTGSPVFATTGDERCVNLDNTFHGSCEMPVPWAGSVIAVLKPEYTSGGTLSRYPLLFGDEVGLSSNGALRVSHASSNRSITWFGPNGTLQATQSQSTNDTMVFGAAHDQKTRKFYSTVDGVTISETAAAAGTVNGLAPAMRLADVGIRFGDMDGNASNTTAMPDFYVRFFELHFFAGNIWTDNLTEAAALMTALRAKYGVA